MTLDREVDDLLEQVRMIVVSLVVVVMVMF